MVKISIFRKAEDKEGKPYNQTLRTVSVSKTFIGFAKSGKILKNEFDALAKDLEPSSTGWVFLN